MKQKRGFTLEITLFDVLCWLIVSLNNIPLYYVTLHIVVDHNHLLTGLFQYLLCTFWCVLFETGRPETRSKGITDHFCKM